VRILLLSDIHSNLEALDACLAAAPAHDLIVNMGDIVGYGADPNAVVDRSRALGPHLVRGNHDKAVAGLSDVSEFNPIAALAALWTRETLTPENMEWLRRLPQGPVRVDGAGDVFFVHGAPMDEDAYIVSLRDAIEPLVTSTVDVTFFGHTHIQGGFLWEQEGSDALRPEFSSRVKAERLDFRLQKTGRYLINPGSVGQPRDGDWRAAFAVFDVDAYTVEFHRVPYDVKVAQDKILAANLPVRLATRLAVGR
jgi:diadenosine tetraphosphatase ApaH/serine/threonine PP2A family protein phosphatase